MWEASFLPFGGAQTSTGTPIDLRFPGQWFQSESGLHQNWMREYDPTTGRYNQADPLGLADGPSVYGYALQNPGRYIDPTGESVWEDLCHLFPHLCDNPPQSCSAPGGSLDGDNPEEILTPPTVDADDCNDCKKSPNCSTKFASCVSSSLGRFWDQQRGMSRCGACNLICHSEGSWPDELPNGQSCYRR